MTEAMFGELMAVVGMANERNQSAGERLSRTGWFSVWVAWRAGIASSGCFFGSHRFNRSCNVPVPGRGGLARKKSPGARAGARFGIRRCYCALLLLFGARVAGVAGFAGDGIAGEGLVAGAICVAAGGRGSLAAVLVPFCPAFLRLPSAGSALLPHEGKAAAQGGCGMNVLVYLVPMALALGLTALIAFFWSIRNRQYDDMEGAALRVLTDDDIEAWCDIQASQRKRCSACGRGDENRRGGLFREAVRRRSTARRGALGSDATRSRPYKRQAEHAEIEGRLASLSKRERDVLDGLIAGLANKQIAYDLGISPRTIEIYRANVMTKMQAASLSDLVRMALVAGVLDAKSG
jgi:cbb3-type cytochrome oxidase maturation protein